MTSEIPLPFQQDKPSRTPEVTARLAWLVLWMAVVGFVLLCALAGYGLWRFRAYAMLPREGSVVEAYSSPVYQIHAGEVLQIAVPPRQPLPLREGETVQVAESAPPGVVALVSIWDGSTVQLLAGSRVRFQTLRATPYSDKRQEVALELSRGQILLGVAQLERYEQVEFFVRLPGNGLVGLQPNGNYLIRSGDIPEVAVRKGQALVSLDSDGPTLTVSAGEKALFQPDGLVVEPARWELLVNGDFEQGLAGWSFRSDQTGDGGVVDARQRLEQHDIQDRLNWAVGLERKGASGIQDRCLGILSQQIGEDMSPYRSARLEFDLRINYQSLPGGGLDYPFIVRIDYQDEQGRNRQYLYGFYYRVQEGVNVDLADGLLGEVIRFPHYRWEHVSLELLDLQPRPVLLNGVDLLASGHDYLSWVANVSLLAE